MAKFKDKRDEIDWNSQVLEGAPRLTQNYLINQVFSSEEEALLSEYFQTMSKLHHGLNPKSSRRLSYDLVVANGTKMPLMGNKLFCWKIVVQRFYEKA